MVELWFSKALPSPLHPVLCSASPPHPELWARLYHPTGCDGNQFWAGISALTQGECSPAGTTGTGALQGQCGTAGGWIPIKPLKQSWWLHISVRIQFHIYWCGGAAAELSLVPSSLAAVWAPHMFSVEQPLCCHLPAAARFGEWETGSGAPGTYAVLSWARGVWGGEQTFIASQELPLSMEPILLNALFFMVSNLWTIWD